MKLIKLQDKFILVSDEDWAKGDWYYTNLGNIYQDTGKFLPDDDDEENKAQFTSTVFKRKIIAGIPDLPLIDFSLLREEDCKTIGWVDVEKLAQENHDLSIEDWYDGFQTHQSLNDKQFSLKDMKKAINLAYVSGGGGDSYQECEQFVEEQLSLQQTEWNVEIEMEEGEEYLAGEVGGNEIWASYPSKPKIVNNSIKVLKILNC